MASKVKVIFELNTNQGSRIKLLAIHPIKQWVGIINENNTFSLWNFQEKILIKSFSCNTLDDNKGVQIKQIVFFDKHSLFSNENCRNMKNNIIFVTNSKLIFYNYITDEIKQTSQKDLDQKNIRKVCVYSQSKICIAMSDGSFKVLDTKDQTKGSMSIRTIRGFHTKPIAWIFSYNQSFNEMPRVVTASDQDGLMACWNIDLILKSPANLQVATPSFKFQSASKKARESITNQQINFLQYDSSSYRIITVNDHFIRLWSTMTGIQLRRIKNTYRYRQIIFFNHFTYVSQSFVAHSKTSKIIFIRNSDGSILLNNQIELKNFFPGTYNQNPQQSLQITNFHTLPHHSSHLFIVTNINMCILQMDKFYFSPYGFHFSFMTKLSTINSRELINKGQGQIRKGIKMQEIQNIKFQEDILLNSFYLSADQDHIYFNLLQIQYSTMLHESRKYKMHTFQQISPFKQAEGGRSIILVNFTGTEIIVFNKLICYYEIYASVNENQTQNLLSSTSGHQNSNRIDFYSTFKIIGRGYARDIVYHQFKDQFAIVAGYDNKDNQVQFKMSKQKKGGLFKAKDQAKMVLQGEPVKYRVHIYQKIKLKYEIVAKSDPFLSKIYRIFNFGSFFGYSITKGTLQLLEIISSEKNNTRQIQGILNTPEQVFVSYCQSYYILSYDKYFVVFKVQQNGVMSYFRSFQFTILHGYFWQKYFFFLTSTSLYFLQISNEDSITIKIADISTMNIIQKLLQNSQQDDLQPQHQILPAGQQQILTIINKSIVLVNENNNVCLVKLDEIPYIVFCLQIASGVMQQTYNYFKGASEFISQKMRQTLTNYGMIAPDLL